MVNALFGFEDHAAGERAARRLLEDGLAPAAVRLHDDGPGATEAAAPGPNGSATATPDEMPMRDRIDEQLTGGLVTNLLGLFQGLFDWGSSPHDAAAFEQIVRRGGAVVGVDAGDATEQSRIEHVMEQAGCTLQTGWSDAPVR